MKDQAASLRELKANFDKLVGKQKPETLQDFLKKVKKDSPLSAYILIYQDSTYTDFPEIASWLPKISPNPNNLYFWDQAGLLKSKILTKQEIDALPFTVLGKQVEMLDLSVRNDSQRMEFLKNIISTLDKYAEVWVTIKASEITYYKYLLNAANAICIMLSDNDEALLKGYETVKTLHLNQITSPVSILEFSSKPFPTPTTTAPKIKNVAKKFLGIDLSNVGVVLSSCRYIPMNEEGYLSNIKPFEEHSEGGFMYSFSENIVNLPLGN